MKIIHFDCFSGISGDMTLGAFIDAGMPIGKLRGELEKLKVDGYTLSAKKVMKCGITGTKATVRIKKTMPARDRRYKDIVKVIEKSKLVAGVKETALLIFERIAKAESKVHNVAIDKVHFHEVGAVDSIVDIVGAAICFDQMDIGLVSSSPVNIGSGSIKTSHGVLPVPAPATALLLKGIPTYAGGPQKELTSPTGAAIIKAMATSFGPQPFMTCEKVGTGAGGYDFDHWPNIMRVFIGEAEDNVKGETLLELATNIDDMNPERYSVVTELLFAAGALDVTLTPVQMKKGRPGITLTVLSGLKNGAAMRDILFAHTTTLGIRQNHVSRVSLPRVIKKVKTKYGMIEVKIAGLPNGGKKIAPEFESVKKAAEKMNAPFDDVYREVLAKARIDVSYTLGL
ncbi:hypothetical protein MNBD_NITROSPINAE02-658 [hydrothermal vent metagenome]|uniref:Nickel insertion protein n=1 Tax=hydrothermal vent metagenome TaxID=652676 RepID=A0A3B1C470_9ZZZZ